MTYPTTAFPTMFYHQEDRGMTLRDYFAAKAMHSLISIEGGNYNNDAKEAYRVADEMLKAREL